MTMTMKFALPNPPQYTFAPDTSEPLPSYEVVTVEAPNEQILMEMQAKIQKISMLTKLSSPASFKAAIQQITDSHKATQAAVAELVDADLKSALKANFSNDPWEKPKYPAFTNDQILSAFEQVVRRRGEDYVDYWVHGTNAEYVHKKAKPGMANSDTIGSRPVHLYSEDNAPARLYREARCVQGDVMAELGLKQDTKRWAGAYTGVSEVLGRPDLIEVFFKAEAMNDSNQPWGEILAYVKSELAKAA